jgi:Sigma-70, region 4
MNEDTIPTPAQAIPSATAAECDTQDAPTANCLLGRIEEVGAYLRRLGYGEFVVDVAVTAVLVAAVPYVNGEKKCEIGNRRAWVYSVARRAAARAARQQACAFLDPSTIVITTEKSRPADFTRLYDALGVLTDFQREAVVLCFFEGLTAPEAASGMGKPVGTFKHHLADGLRRLRKLLAD